MIHIINRWNFAIKLMCNNYIYLTDISTYHYLQDPFAREHCSPAKKPCIPQWVTPLNPSSIYSFALRIPFRNRCGCEFYVVAGFNYLIFSWRAYLSFPTEPQRQWPHWGPQQCHSVFDLLITTKCSPWRPKRNSKPNRYPNIFLYLVLGLQ